MHNMGKWVMEFFYKLWASSNGQRLSLIFTLKILK